MQVKVFSSYELFRASSGASGYDIRCPYAVRCPKGEVTVICTGIRLELPPSYEAQIRPRSSIGKLGVIIPNSPATIDSDYRGEIKIALLPLLEDFFIISGDRIAQLVFVNVEYPEIQYTQELSNTPRQEGGFGSTGR